MTPVDVGNTKKTVHFKNCLGVFQGGGCKAIAFIGAYEEARKRGVYFSEVAGTSAGSIFAALISAGATPEYLDRLVNNTCFSDFNSPVEKMVSKKYGSKIGHINKFLPRTKKIKKYKDIFYFLLNLGLYSSAQLESWLNDRLKELLGVSEGIINFSDLKIPLHVIATDIQNQNSITWNYNNSPNMSVAYAVRCSCSIPGYFQPVDMKYVDGGLVSNLPTFSVQDDDIHYEKILCFTLSSQSNAVSCVESYITSVVNAVIDGAVHIQGLLQSNTHHIEIKNLPITTTAFHELDEKLIKEIIKIGRDAASSFFDHEVVKISDKSKSINKLNRDNILNAIVMEQARNYKEILVSLPNTRLVYSLFPTFLDWVHNGLKVIFFTNPLTRQHKDYEHEKYRRFLLEKLGVIVIDSNQIPLSCVLFRSDEHEYNTSIIIYEDEELIRVAGHGRIYKSIDDKIVHESILKSFQYEHENNNSCKKAFTIERISPSDLTRILKNVKQYKNKRVHIQLKTVNINDIKLLTKYVKSYKYNQISKFINILDEFNIERFESCAIKINDPEKTEFIVTPPVIEKYNDEYRLIEGNSRIILSYRDLQLEKIKAIIVEHVEEELPSRGAFSTDCIIVTTKDKVGPKRYNEFNYQYFRKIEEHVRPPRMYIGDKL